MKQIILLLALFVAICAKSFSQVIVIPISTGRTTPAISTIPVDSGKFFTIQLTNLNSYNSEGVNVGTTTADVTFYDADLKVVTANKCQLGYLSGFKQVVRDQDGYGILFHSKQKGTIDFITLNRDGKIIQTSKMNVSFLASTYDDTQLFANPNEKGFYLFRPTKKKVRELQKVDIKCNTLWKRKIATAQYSIIANFTASFGNNSFTFDYSPKDGVERNCMTVQTADGTIISDIALYRKPAKGEKKNILSNVLIKNDTIYTLGLYFEKKAKKHTHDGLFLTALNLKGEKIFTRLYSVETGITPLLSNEKKIEAVGKIIPRFMIPTADGIIVTAEEIDMIPSGAFATGVATGVALGMIGIPLAFVPQNSAYKVKDMLFLKIGASGDLEKITLVDKYVSLKQIPVPVTELATYFLNQYSVFDANSILKDSNRQIHHILLKENPAKDQGLPRIACIRMAGEGATFQLRSKSLRELIQEDKKVKYIDWALLSTGDVLLQYATKEKLHLSKIVFDDFQ